VLSQTLGDLEVIVSDNASTDSTSEIICRFATRDGRVRWHRNARNIGVAGNFNQTFRLSRSEYFHWHGYDDLMAPTYLEKCVEMMDRDPTVVVVQSQTRYIDSEGRHLEFDPDLRMFVDSSGQVRIEPPDELYATSFDPLVRYRDSSTRACTCIHAMGVLRSSVARQTGLFGPFCGHDRAFIIEMSLWGRFGEVPEPVFFKREHVRNSRMVSKAERMRWIGGAGFTHRFTKLREHAQIVGAILRSPLSPRQKMTCLSIGVSDAIGRRVRRTPGR
jgi:glycosyltransferase involved in cell wall biosynthesis